VVRLDRLEALVHQARRVDRDRPPSARSGWASASATLTPVRSSRPREGAARGVRTSRSTVPGALGADQLVQGGVLGVHRSSTRPGPLGERHHQLAADHQALLVGERDVDPGASARPRSRPARPPRRSRSGPVGARAGDQLPHASSPESTRPLPRPAPARPHPGRRARPRERRAPAPARARSPAAAGGEPTACSSSECATTSSACVADRPGRAEYQDLPHLFQRIRDEPYRPLNGRASNAALRPASAAQFLQDFRA